MIKDTAAVARRNPVASVALAGVALAAAIGLSSSPARAATASCANNPTMCTLSSVTPRTGIYVGTALDSSLRSTDLSDIAANFSSITTPSLVWSLMEPNRTSPNFATADRVVTLARSRGIRIRGHNLIWNARWTPKWALDYMSAGATPAAVYANTKTAVDYRVKSVVQHFRGLINTYDVVNEPLAFNGGLNPTNPFANGMGEDYIAEAFKVARAYDPAAKLFLNETIPNPVEGNAKADSLVSLVRRLKARGVPIDGVGLETHGALGVSSPWFPDSTDVLKEYMNKFVEMGLKVEITELEVSLPHVIAEAGDPAPTRAEALDLQAGVYSRVGLACAQVRSCTGVTVWGVRDQYTWLDINPSTAALGPHEPLLLNSTGAKKPAYAALRDSLYTRIGAGGVSERNSDNERLHKHRDRTWTKPGRVEGDDSELDVFWILRAFSLTKGW